MSFQGGYVYVIEEKEVARHGEDIYKVEGSTMFINRIMQYPIWSAVHMAIKVNDAITAEREILEHLASHAIIKQRQDIGVHYFQGSLSLIINVIAQTASHHDMPSHADIDPVVLISEYIVAHKENLQGRTTDALSFYKTVSGEVCLSRNLTYNKFVSILRKHGIREHAMSYGPCFVFPPLR
jgi:hypothetical protein